MSIYATGFTALPGGAVIVRVTELESLNAKSHVYRTHMTKEELLKKARLDYPELQPEQHAALVEFVISMVPHQVTPKEKDSEKCNTETQTIATPPNTGRV